jgi:hypothetical protein
MPGGKELFQNQQHSGISQGIGLHALQVEKFRDTFVIRAEQLLIDLRLYRCASYLFKSITREKLSLES